MITFTIETPINMSKVKEWKILGKPSETHELTSPFRASSINYSSITSVGDIPIPDGRCEFPGMRSIGKRVTKWLEDKDNPDDAAKIARTRVGPASTSCLLLGKEEHSVSKIVSHKEHIYAEEKKNSFLENVAQLLVSSLEELKRDAERTKRTENANR